MMRKIWVNKPADFKAAEQFDLSYYLKMSPKKRLETLQFLREIYPKTKSTGQTENKRRLQRVVKIIDKK